MKNKQIKTKRQLAEHYETIHIKNQMLGIPEEIENTYNYLFYTWKRKNPYNALLYDKFLYDFNIEEFNNLCFIAVYDSKEKGITASWALVKLLQEELAVSRKKSQMQAVKISIDDVLYMDTLNLLDEKDYMKQVERDSVVNDLYQFISNNLTTSQLQALQKYLFNGKKLDSRQKKLIKNKLKNPHFRQILYDILY